MCVALINDTAGQSWSLAATDDGHATITFNTAAPVPPFLIAEYRTPSTVYELKYIVGAGLGLFFSSGTNVPLQVALDTPDKKDAFLLQVVQGSLQLLAGNLGIVFGVGMLLPGDGSYPKPIQPGGPGTPVTMPQQTQGEMLGLWVAGCGHWFNNYDIRTAEICGTPSALVCCPLCLYIQRIITPYLAIYSDANSIIFA